MARDKQLCGIELGDVLQKRRLDQALNAKEFAVLVGVSYSTARGWFRLSGFPVVQGLIFWDDFVQWRRVHTGLDKPKDKTVQGAKPKDGEPTSQSAVKLPARAAQILLEAS